MSWNFFDAWMPKRYHFLYNDVSPEALRSQTELCQEKFEAWEDCTERRGFNDPTCRDKLLDRYYVCVAKLNAMRAAVEDKDLN
jgi:hypothetical protein